MGAVYLAEHALLGRRAAIKFMNDKHLNAPDGQHLRARFLREAHALSTFSHPHIASVYDYGETEEGKPYIIMEWVDGRTLNDLLDKYDQPLSSTLKILEAVAEALAEAHRHGIIHRDIKPSNIAINERGQVKVLDFGLAKHVNGEAALSGGVPADPAQVLTQTAKGVVPGTPRYMSPEQALGKPLDPRSDIFSFGALLYECITGRPAFSGANEVETYTQVIRDNPPPPSQTNPEVPSKLEDITLRCLAKSTHDRYRSAEELVTDLREVRTELEEGGRPGTPLSRHRHKKVAPGESPPVRRRAYLIALPLCVLAAGALLWLAWPLFNYHQSPPEAVRWYEDGAAALHDGTFYKASKLLEEAIKIDDNFPLAHARLAEAWMELGYSDKANREITRANSLALHERSGLSRLDTLYLQALTASVARNFGAAAQTYREIVDRSQEREKPNAYVDLGLAYEKNDEPEKAAESYQAAASLDSKQASAFLNEGALLVRQQNFADAEAALDKALNIYNLQTNPEGIAEVLYQRGTLFAASGNVARARAELERALDIVHTFANLPQQVRTQLQLSSVYRLMGDTELARKHTVEAIDLARSNGMEDLTAQGVIELGTIFFFRNEIEDAEKQFEEGLALARKYGLHGSEARAQFLLGSLHIQQDEAGPGEEYIKQALPFYEQGEYRKEVMQSQTLLGQAYDLKGEYTRALEAFEQQLQLATRLGNRMQEALAHKGIGTVLTHQEKYTEALGHVEQSYAIYSDLGNQLYAGYSLISRADLLWRLGQYDGAQAALNQAAALAAQPDGKFKQLWGRIHIVGAPMMLSRQRLAESIARAKQAAALDDSKSKHATIEVKAVLGLAQYLAGAKDQGRRACEEDVEAARQAGDPRLLAGALLALAEVRLESGTAAAAADAAREAQQILAREAQADSEWRAWLILGRASRQLGDDKQAREGLAQADALLSSLRQRWGTENFDNYLARPDVKRYREALIRASATLRL